MSNFYKDTGLNEARKIFGINMSDLLDLLESTDSDIEVYPKIFEELKKLELDKNLSKLKAVLNILGIKTDEINEVIVSYDDVMKCLKNLKVQYIKKEKV